MPTFSITNLILDYIVKFELCNAILKKTQLPFKFKYDLYEKFKTEEIQAIADLIGIPIGFQKASEIQTGKIIHSTTSPFTILTNYRSSQDFVKSYNRAIFVAPSNNLLLHINKLILSRIVDEWETAKFRNFSERPNEVYDVWYKYRDFYPDLDSEKYFEEFFHWLNNPKIKIHKLIQLSIFVYEMIDKAPLQTGNQITTILTFSASLKDFGYNIENILPIAKIFYFLNEDLLEAFKLAKSKKDLTIFIEALLYSMSLEIMQVESQITSTFETKVKKHLEIETEFNNRQTKILDYLQFNGKISRIECAKMMGVSFMTAFRDLNDLLGKGYLSHKGNGRATVYTLATEERKEGKNLKVFVDDSRIQ